MPIYEYQCPECANIFEEWAKASEMKELSPCPLCQTPSERIISHTAFVLKGGGWYVTDYGYRKNISEDGANASAAGSAAAVSATATSAPKDSSTGDAPKTDNSAAPAASPTPSGAPSGTGPTSPASSVPSTATPAAGANSAA